MEWWTNDGFIHFLMQCMDGLDKELVWVRNIHLPLTTVEVWCRLAVSNKRDLYNIMTANDHNVIGPCWAENERYPN